MEDCNNANALDQNVLAGKHDGKTVSSESGVTFTDYTTLLANGLEDENSVTQKIKLLLLKHQEEIEELRQNHEIGRAHV